MTYTATQRQRAAARLRALQRQHERAREAIPAGFELAPSGPQSIPMGSYCFERLAELVGAPDMVGFVLVTSCRARCCIYGKSYPRFGSTRAWSVGAYRCLPGDRIELSAVGRGSGALSTAKLLPFRKPAGYEPGPVRMPAMDTNGLPASQLSPLPWEPQS